MHFISKTLAFAARREVRGVVGTMAIKALSVLSAFVLFTFAARVLGNEQFGHFAMFFSAASMLAVVAVFGQEMLVIRTWNENISKDRCDFVKGGVVFSLMISAIGGLAGAAVFALFFAITDTAVIALSAGSFVGVAVFLLFTSSLSRTVVSILTGDGQRELTAFLPANVTLIACYAFGVGISMAWVINLLTFGMIVAVAIQVYCILRVVRHSYPTLIHAPCSFDKTSWLPSSYRLWIASVLESSNQYLDVILIGFLLDPMAAGAYFVATRLANGFASVADGFNMFAMRHFPKTYYNEDTVGIAKLLHTLAILIALAVIVGLTVVAVAGHWLLMLFGPEYASYYHVLLILCVGTAAMAASGPAAPVLMLTGSEAPYLRIVALSVAIRIAGFVLLIPFFGIVGAATATMVSLVVMAVLIGLKSSSVTGLNVTATLILFPNQNSMMKVKET